MIIHFYLHFSTRFGQTLFVCGNNSLLGNDNRAKALPLQYLNDQLWHGSVEIDATKETDPISYYYILREDKEEEVIEFQDDKVVDVAGIRAERLYLYDTWNYAGEIENAFFSSAFREVLLKNDRKKPSGIPPPKKVRSFTHEFRVKAPLLGKDEFLFIGGTGKVLNEWDTDKPKLLTKNANWWSIKLNLGNEQFPVAYKYGICRGKDKKFVTFEEGNNRLLMADVGHKSRAIVHDGFVQMKTKHWKGTGVAIPVFSLRSRKGFGIGEFTDLELLVDWAAKTGLKLIQLLPVNDTTATHTRSDSYPYSAISAFALHPVYINLEEVAGSAHAAIIKPLAKKRQQLNASPGLEYEQVMKFKLSVLRELYQAQKDVFSNDIGYFNFFELNRHWLVPYAAFCYLRDKYSTADFNQWRSNSSYDETAIQRLVSPGQKHYDEIALHYFTQYHLYLQLKNATAYAHKNGIIVKGDIPIGIYRNSVDAWIAPSLFNMNEQAGAPPDAFTVKGQNWGFPTYNWARMQEDKFTWWRKRFEQMNNYFDAFRIDHILGFFRIWSIPSHAVEGIMGRFVPAIPVRINELFERKIAYDRHRYTKPYITEAILEGLFGDKLPEVRDVFFDGLELKAAFNTQRKIENYFTAEPEPCTVVKQALFDLVSNVILFEEENSQGQKFHFRISMENTSSFHNLDAHNQQQLKELYIDYFYHRQDELWRTEAMHKLPGLKRSTEMLVCGEDLGMVPHCVPQVMQQLGILSLEIQRMPKKTDTEFFHPNDAPYLSVVSPSTHDMSTIRGWWEEDAAVTKRFYNNMMGHAGDAPLYAEPWINKEIILQHLYSPAMWSVFQLQDLLGISAELRREDPRAERINLPSDPDHYWHYRMHIYLEDLLKEKAFNDELKADVESSGR